MIELHVNPSHASLQITMMQIGGSFPVSECDTGQFA